MAPTAIPTTKLTLGPEATVLSRAGAAKEGGETTKAPKKPSETKQRFETMNVRISGNFDRKLRSA